MKKPILSRESNGGSACAGLFTVAVFFFTFAVAQAQTAAVEKAFYRGNEAFEKKDAAGAIAAYEEAIAAGADGPAIHFNLANAYLSSGALGPAIRHYRIANLLAPRDEDVRANLKFARSRAQEKLAPAEPPAFLRTLLFVHRDLTIDESFKLFFAVQIAAAVLWILRSLLNRSWMTGAAIVLWVIAAAIGVSLCLRTAGAGGKEEAVVLPEKAEVRTGPAETYSVLFLLHAGAEVAVGEKSGDWMQITLEDGRKGWLPTTWLGIVNVP